MSAFLAGKLHAGHTLCGRDAIWRATFSASRLNAGIALLNNNGLARHRFADQALGLLTHRLFRHSPHLSLKPPPRQLYSTDTAVFDTLWRKIVLKRLLGR